MSGGAGACASESAETTWSDDVAPIVDRSCAGCHRRGGIAPFALTQYHAAAPLAVAMRDAVVAGRMPPYPPGDASACRTLADARALPAGEVATLVAWAEGGAPEGRLGVALADDAHGGALDADAILDPGVDYTPAPGGPDDYRCFLVDPGLSGATFVTGLEARPGDSQIVHHVIVYAVPDEATEALLAMRDAADAAPGYTCFGDGGPGTRMIGGWAPGAPPMRFPEGTGVALPGGRALVVQVHYHPTEETRSDRTRVRLATAAAVDRPVELHLLADTTLALPARTEGIEAGAELRVSSDRFAVYGVTPHMHELGRSIRVSVDRADGIESCLIEIPKWDFEWQGTYFFEEPLPMSAGDVIRVDCVYDNTSDRTVYWGEGTEDEMCVAFIAIAERR